jgi:hypothetical protein
MSLLGKDISYPSNSSLTSLGDLKGVYSLPTWFPKGTNLLSTWPDCWPHTDSLDNGVWPNVCHRGQTTCSSSLSVRHLTYLPIKDWGQATIQDPQFGGCDPTLIVAETGLLYFQTSRTFKVERVLQGTPVHPSPGFYQPCLTDFINVTSLPSSHL